MDVPQTGYARNGDVHIAYQSVGSGDTVFVGTPPIISNIEVMWEEASARRFLTRMASFCRFIHFDKRGQGQSDRDTGVPTIDDRIGDLAAVLDAAGVDRAVIGGISEGGSTAALFAATYPERVSKLVLFAAPIRILPEPGFPGGVDGALFDALFAEWAAKWGTPETLTVGLAAASMTGDETFLKWVNRYERQSTSPGGLVAASRWIRDIDIRPVLPLIRCPTLILHRQGDPLCEVAQSRVAAELIPNARYLELEGIDHLPWYGDQDEVLDLLEEFTTGSTRSPERPDRVLATVMFTDIVGSTEKAVQLGDERWREVLEVHDRVAQKEVSFHAGRLVKSTGDGRLATFDGPGRALKCALSLRGELGAAGIDIRVGVHTGEIELRGDDVGGIAVHIASRVEGKAAPGEVMTTRTVKDLVAGSAVAFDPRGVHTLKGVPDDWQLYAVTSA